MVVPHQTAHKIPRGDVQVEQREPDAVYQLGKATVRIFAPKNLTPEELERRDDVIHEAIADIIRSLPVNNQGA